MLALSEYALKSKLLNDSFVSITSNRRQLSFIGDDDANEEKRNPFLLTKEQALKNIELYGDDDVDNDNTNLDIENKCHNNNSNILSFVYPPIFRKKSSKILINTIPELSLDN